MSRSTLSLIERGENIALSNLIKIMRNLDVLHVFDTMHYSPSISPMLVVREAMFKRKKARSKKSNSSNTDDSWS